MRFAQLYCAAAVPDRLLSFRPSPAGLGAIQPEQGLATLLAALHGGWQQRPVLTASPLVWPTLLRLQASAAFEGFAALAAPAPAAEGPQAAQGSRGRAAATVGSAPQAPAANRLAEVQVKLLAITAEVLGSAVDPAQSLMEVRSRRAARSASEAPHALPLTAN